ncbi:MAG: hypothetical protein KF689_03120 [Gemmatimonadaceae bacterium]|nr:hypothetical protein [Gemmatimonadaceae bacterium]MCW5827536.1 hypothetical protein [Gemmatimonadaceae bacterium]
MRPSFRRLVLPFAAVALVGSCGKDPGPSEDSPFTLELIWLGTLPNASTRSSFDAAGNTIRATITAPLTTVAIPPTFTNLSQCGLNGHPDIARDNIRGLRIYAVIEPIDSVGGTLGQAGPCLIRANDIPALGIMRFDSWDVAALQSSGRLTRVVLHEMLHVLGFGTVWFDQVLIDTVTNASDARFLGENARAACALTNGGATQCAATVPVHSADGEGSRFSHWRESTFGNELMTPFLSAGATPYSATTIRSLADLGYQVTLDVADPYTLPGAALMASEAAPSLVTFPEPMLPRWQLDGRGGMRPVRPR